MQHNLVEDDVFVMLSAPAPGIMSWATLTPISRLLLPLLAVTVMEESEPGQGTLRLALWPPGCP